MIEPERGCGYRKVGGAYLVGKGLARPCDALPIKLTPCGECGLEVKWSRAMQIIRVKYIYSKYPLHGDPERDPCVCNWGCPICSRSLGEKIGLMFVGSEYTPQSFIKESQEIGVSKRIAPHCIPKAFELGKTWVLLAKKYKEKPNEVFYAFKPEKIEILLWDDNEGHRKANEWIKQGFIPVFVPVGDKDHK